MRGVITRSEKPLHIRQQNYKSDGRGKIPRPVFMRRGVVFSITLLPSFRAQGAVWTLIASAVATKEATDEDSNWLLRQPANATAVAIRKQAKLANGYRRRGRAMG
ncbi:hypothetical protein [Desulfovibrio sp. ZJ369]|uniref:hypothetical protein n=1 Tax=Desulfovibrio sp. ZJ369 TaxID=2709793 RepID=UPI0013ED5348|nr:hypothetical protein [Desulfovibrio sp. ZJ369]